MTEPRAVGSPGVGASRLDEALAAAAAAPDAFGAILCDYEGETVAVAMGPVAIPAPVLDRAASQLPGALQRPARARDYLLRLAGAEPCALLALFDRPARRLGAGALTGLELGYANARLVVRRLPDDYYLVIVLARRRDPGPGRARRLAERVRPLLVGELS